MFPPCGCLSIALVATSRNPSSSSVKLPSFVGALSANSSRHTCSREDKLARDTSWGDERAQPGRLTKFAEACEQFTLQRGLKFAWSCIPMQVKALSESCKSARQVPTLPAVQAIAIFGR